MFAILAFRARLRAQPFLGWSLLVLAVQHAAVAAVAWRYAPDALIWSQISMYPLIGQHAPTPLGDLLTLSDVALACLVAWTLWGLAYARVAELGYGGWVAALAVVPVIQLPAILLLAILPRSRNAPRDAAFPWATAAQGVVVGALLSWFSVAVGALVFRSYGWTMFLLAPFLIGLVTGYLANRAIDIGGGRTATLVLAALALGGLGLLSLALEGIVCLALAAPLAAALGLFGSLLGRAIAERSSGRAREVAGVFAMLPLAFALEHGAPPATHFAAARSLDIAAPPAAVWQALTHMGTIEARPALIFRLGVSYPTAGVIRGQGVGAIREGHFSTGVAYERVTDWRPGRRLAFDVLSDAPSLKELSPYAHVNAPHVTGYFRTRTAVFDLAPLPGGRTRLTITTTHELDLAPAAYWTPIARWTVDQNQQRVLGHFAILATRPGS